VLEPVEIKLAVVEDEDQENSHPARHPRGVDQSLTWDGRT